MANPFATTMAEVTFTPDSGTAKQSYTTYGFYMLEPKYTTKKKKEVVVSLPYMDGDLDLSELSGRVYWQACDVTYKFVQQWEPTAAGMSAMRARHTSFETFCWGFLGTITDDYGAVTITGARCTSFTATPSPADNTLTVEVTFRGVRS